MTNPQSGAPLPPFEVICYRWVCNECGTTIQPLDWVHAHYCPYCKKLTNLAEVSDYNDELYTRESVEAHLAAIKEELENIRLELVNDYSGYALERTEILLKQIGARK
jgi:hypothetical protein